MATACGILLSSDGEGAGVGAAADVPCALVSEKSYAAVGYVPPRVVQRSTSCRRIKSWRRKEKSKKESW